MSKIIKDICEHLWYDNCYYRQPVSRFKKTIGEEYTNMLVKKGYLVDSPKIDWIKDFNEPCYEFSKKFRMIFEYNVFSFWEFVRYFLFYGTIEKIKSKFKS